MVQSKGLKLLTFNVASTEGLLESDEINMLLEKESFAAESEKDPEYWRDIIVACFKHCDLMLHDLDFMAKVKQQDFKMAVVDANIIGTCIALVPYHFDIPFVVESDTIPLWDMGIPFLPSFMPATIQESTDRMSFSEKLTSLFFFFFDVQFSVCVQRMEHDVARGIRR